MSVCDEEANKELINFVIGVIQIGAPLQELSLPAFGGSSCAYAGESVLEMLCQQDITTMETVNFSSNPLWWYNDNTIEMLSNLIGK